MSYNPTLRRNQMIAPFGVGAIHVLKGSRAVVTAGLDHWFCKATAQQIACVRVNEPRLQAKLGVNHFRLPPGPETELKGAPKLEIPLFRFPSWYICPRCHGMEQRPLSMDGDAACGKKECNREIMRQVRFAAVCDHGHLQDFPWKEWVRRERIPPCKGQNCDLAYRAGGSGSLADITIECKTCQKRRSLGGIMSGELPDKTATDQKKQMGYSTLSRTLLADEKDGKWDSGCGEFSCQGGRVWLGEAAGAWCSRPLRAVLINATNVHYAQVESALWIPPANQSAGMETLRGVLDRPDIRNHIKVLRSFNLPTDQIAQNILQSHGPLFQGKTTTELAEAMSSSAQAPDASSADGLDQEEVIRYPEYLQLQMAREPLTTDEDLEIRLADVARLPVWLKEIVTGISLVDRLRETRAFKGFNRLVPQPTDGSPPPHSHLWRTPPVLEQDKWLPCAVVYGEGIFIQFNEDRLTNWESSPQLESHLRPLQHRENAAAARMGRPPRSIEPRFVLLHTLSHLIMRRLVFECGYGSASLRERLYVSTNPSARMGGILIYTASGDCEGSMGGLVRMGEPEHLSRVLTMALNEARWCSADPVCTESGMHGGQGIDGLNIAACHCCTLIPETSCEQFNSLLDRQLVLGRAMADEVAFFKFS